MNHEIVCEDFKMTDAIRNHAEQIIEKLEKNCEKPMNISIFFSRVGPGLYKAGIETRLYNKELYAEASDRDLYEAATQAKRSVRKQIIELNQMKKSASKGK